jgi:hypothetical protein
MKTVSKFLLALPCALAVLVACGQNPNPNQTSMLGSFEATFDAGSKTAYGRLNTQGVIAESNVTFGTATFTDTTDTTTNTRYLKAVYPVSNNTASAIANLTLYAFNRSSANLGGTGMRTLTNFVGTTSSSDAAQAIKSTHGMTNSSTLTSGQEDFQAFQSSELSSIKTTAVTNGVMSNSDTVLEYGYVARYCTANCSSANPTWSRSIPAGQTGRVTIAYKLPNASVNTSYKFTASFVLSAESTTRVTRSREETTSNAQTRATVLGASQVVLIGSDSDTSSVGSTLRLSNLKTSTNPNYLYPAFNITLQYSSNVSSSFQADFAYAASKWEDIITADISDWGATIGNTPCSLSATGWSSVSSVDDVIIFVDVTNIDGAGNTLAQAGPCSIRSSNKIPIAGVMQFDSADFTAGSTLAKDTILHEMGHVLGIGTLWSTLGIILGNTTTGCDTTYYTGSNGLAEWITFGGTGNIPLETGGGTGTCEGHWKESNFDTELMTGYSDTTTKLSRMTIGALKDIGYSVNYAFADAYTPVSLLRAPLTVQNHANQISEKLFTNPIELR